MKRKNDTRPLMPLLLVSLFATRALAQGTFSNLNFEAANVPSVPSGQFGSDVSVGVGVPGWTVYIGGIPATTMLHNNESLGAAAVSILGPQWFQPQILEGSYTVLLQGSSAGPPSSAAVGQSAQLPIDVASVRFFGNGVYTMTFGGHQIPLVVLGSTATYNTFGGDLSAYASQAGELRFQGSGLLDNISFSNQPIPEPSTWVLMLLGLTAISLKRRIWAQR